MPSREPRPTGTEGTVEPAVAPWPSDAVHTSCGLAVRRVGGDGDGRWVSQWWKHELVGSDYEVVQNLEKQLRASRRGILEVTSEFPWRVEFGSCS